METTINRPSLAQRLDDPQTSEALHRLLDQVESFNQILQVATQLPNLVAIATDFFDAVSRQAAEDGIDLEQRATQLVSLLVKITQPENMQAIQRLADQLPKLEQGSQLLDQLPNLLAIAMDVFDQWANDVKAQGIDLEQSVRQGLHAALYLGGQIQKEEIDRISYLMKSDLLNFHTVQTASKAGSALASCHQGTCDQPVPKRVGFFGLLSAMRDPNTQRALSFGLQFAKCFGGELNNDKKLHPKSNS